MKFKDLFKAPPSETYIKNSSNLVTALLIIAGILYYPTKGYGSVIALSLAMFVLMGQKLLLSQTNKYFAEMYAAKQQFEKTKETDYLLFIEVRAKQMLTDNKVLSDKAKREIEQLLAYVKENLVTERENKQ